MIEVEMVLYSFIPSLLNGGTTSTFYKLGYMQRDTKKSIKWGGMQKKGGDKKCLKGNIKINVLKSIILCCCSYRIR